MYGPDFVEWERDIREGKLGGKRISEEAKSSLENDFSRLQGWNSPSSHVKTFLFPFYMMAGDVRSAQLSQVAPVAGVTASWRASAVNAACVHFAVLSLCLLRRLSPPLPLFFFLLLPPLSPSSTLCETTRWERKTEWRKTAKKKKKFAFPFFNSRLYFIMSGD